MYTAEFRGPGIHHGFDDSADDYDLDLDQRTRTIGGRSGNVILLRDGTEVLSEAADNDHDGDMFDQSSDEEKDLESQVQKVSAEGDGGRDAREETPGPGPSVQKGSESAKTEEAKSGTGPGKTVEEPKLKAASDSA